MTTKTIWTVQSTNEANQTYITERAAHRAFERMSRHHPYAHTLLMKQTVLDSFLIRQHKQV